MKQLVAIHLMLFLILAICCTKTSVTEPEQNEGLPSILFLSFDPLVPESYNINDTVYVHIRTYIGETGMTALFSSKVNGDFEEMDISDFDPDRFPPIYDYGVYTTFDGVIPTKPFSYPIYENASLEVSPFGDIITVYVEGKKYGNSYASIKIELK